jgi:transposase
VKVRLELIATTAAALMLGATVTRTAAEPTADNATDVYRNAVRVAMTAARTGHLSAPRSRLPACLVGMEACGSAHHWVRTLQQFGHAVRLVDLVPYSGGWQREARLRR